MLILVTGLPGSGTADFSCALQEQLGVDECSLLVGDWLRVLLKDFSTSPSALRQEAMRMREMATWCRTRHVICDFCCATERLRWTLAPEFTVFLDTREKSDYPAMDRMFERPEKADVTLTSWDATTVDDVANQIRLRE